MPHAMELEDPSPFSLYLMVNEMLRDGGGVGYEFK
jgi:hypothetical protein